MAGGAAVPRGGTRRAQGPASGCDGPSPGAPDHTRDVVWGRGRRRPRDTSPSGRPDGRRLDERPPAAARTVPWSCARRLPSAPLPIAPSAQAHPRSAGGPRHTRVRGAIGSLSGSPPPPANPHRPFFPLPTLEKRTTAGEPPEISPTQHMGDSVASVLVVVEAAVPSDDEHAATGRGATGFLAAGAALPQAVTAMIIAIPSAPATTRRTVPMTVSLSGPSGPTVAVNPGERPMRRPPDATVAKRRFPSGRAAGGDPQPRPLAAVRAAPVAPFTPKSRGSTTSTLSSAHPRRATVQWL